MPSPSSTTAGSSPSSTAAGRRPRQKGSPYCAGCRRTWPPSASASGRRVDVAAKIQVRGGSVLRELVDTAGRGQAGLATERIQHSLGGACAQQTPSHGGGRGRGDRNGGRGGGTIPGGCRVGPP